MSERAFSKWLWENELKPMMEAGLAWWFKPPTGSVRGIPDWIGCVNGRFVSLELKKDAAKKDPGREALQRYTAGRIKAAGSVLALSRVTKDSWCKEDRGKILALLQERPLAAPTLLKFN